MWQAGFFYSLDISLGQSRAPRPSLHGGSAVKCSNFLQISGLRFMMIQCSSKIRAIRCECPSTALHFGEFSCFSYAGARAKCCARAQSDEDRLPRRPGPSFVSRAKSHLREDRLEKLENFTVYAVERNIPHGLSSICRT